AVSGFERRTVRTRSVVSCPHVIPTRTWPAVPGTLAGTARRPFGIESRAQDHRRSGRLSHRPSPLSCARLQPIDRTRNAGAFRVELEGICMAGIPKLQETRLQVICKGDRRYRRRPHRLSDWSTPPPL